MNYPNAHDDAFKTSTNLFCIIGLFPLLGILDFFSFIISCILCWSVKKQVILPLHQIIMGQNSSAFAPEEVQRLEKRFNKLDLDRSGTISIDEFVSISELKENPLVKRVVDIFDSDTDGEVDFKGNSFCINCILPVSIRSLNIMWPIISNLFT